MAQNFISCDREQQLLMPPDLREWLPAGHLAWFVLETVGEMDLTRFYSAYRDDGWGRAAYEPSMMVALLLYAYCKGERSARKIEERCQEDVGYRVICANNAPDHVTINRFRSAHAHALAGLFGQVLSLCARAGMVNVGTIALDGTRMEANAAREANLDFERIAREIIEEAGEVDATEDERFGERKGDELPPELAPGPGRQAWIREAKRQLEAEREAKAEPVPRARGPRLVEAHRRLLEDWHAELKGARDHELWRARRIARDGPQGMATGAVRPYLAPEQPTGLVNLTDPDSRLVKGERGFLQGYTAQAAVTEDQLILTAEVITGGSERNTLEPLFDLTCAELEQAGIAERPEVAVADAGFWNTEQIERLAKQGIRALVNPDSGKRKEPSRIRGKPHYQRMREQLDTEEGHELYRKRKQMVEPVFAHTKFNRGIERFKRRGLVACRAEWRLITATHNLLKLWQNSAAVAPA
jgi:transposase